MKTVMIEPYGWQLNVCLGEEDAKRFRAKYWPDRPHGENPRKAAIGYLDMYEDAPRDRRWLMMIPANLHHSTLAHEALHCAIWMMEESDQLADFDTQEGLAYSQGHIMDQVLKKCWPAEYKKERARLAAAVKAAHKE